jgi:putative transposase
LLEYNRSNAYYAAHPRDYHSQEFREAVMEQIDYWNTIQPAWGVKKLQPLIKKAGFDTSRELISELMHEMGIKTIYPHFNISKASKNSRKMPYLLRYIEIWLPNMVWSVDITYVKVGGSHMYLTGIIDWFSRFIVGWTISETLMSEPIIYALKNAITKYGIPAIVNSDQGSQFTSDEYTQFLLLSEIRQSMDGKGKWADNIVIERFFRTLKIENIYIHQYQNPRELRTGIADYIKVYNNIRPHQTLNYQTPQSVYYKAFS